MKKPTKMKHHIWLASFLCSLCILSCTKTSKSEAETTVGDYKVPETIPLTFTEPEPFEWEYITSDTLTTPVTYSLNVDALPSKPFELNTFKPLKAPMKEYDMDWDSYPKEQLKFDSVPFTVTTAPIKKPTITKMKPPGIMEGTNSNLLQLSTNEGLNQNLITAFIENEDGSTWISMGQGISGASSLALYDGENMVTYEYVRINDMTLDDSGRLWMATNSNGIYVLDFKNNLEYSIKPSKIELNLVDILQDHTGTMYLAAFKNGVYTLDSDLKNLQKVTNEGSNLALTLLEDSKENIWLAFEDGIAMIPEQREHMITLPEDTGFTLNFSTDIKEDSSGAIWFCSFQANEVVSLSLQQKKAKLLSNENGYATSGGTRMEEDSKGNMWIAGNNEVYILSKDKQSSKTIGINSTMLINRRGSILKRKDGSIWIGSLDKGALITNEFTLTTEYFDASRGLINDQVWEIEEDSRGELWLGTVGGINIIDPKNNTIKALSHELLHSTFKNTVIKIEQIRDDIFFIDAVWGFSILDRQKNEITVYASNKNSAFRVWDVAFMNEHTFLISTDGGVYIYDIENNGLKKITSKTDPEIFSNGTQVAMYYDKEEILWLPTTNGLAKINLKTNTLSYLKEEQGLCDNGANVISLSKDGELWLATLNGIAILNLEENTLTNLKEENGLIPAETYDLIELDSIMYAASVDGLIPIEKSLAKTTNQGFYTYNGGYGFKSTDYLEGSSKFLRNGQFWAGVGNTSNEFRLMVLDAAPKPDIITTSVHITKMFVMDEAPGFTKNNVDSLTSKASSDAITTKMQWDSVSYPYAIPEGLKLPYDKNSLSFSYASSDVLNREQLNYRFILDGVDEDWIYAEKTTKTKNYYNLKPGTYTFKVSARGFNNKWSTPAALEFKINPPWWQTWWATLLFFLLGATAIWFIIDYRSRWLQKENRILEERVTHRTAQLKHKIDELKSTQSQLIQSEKMASLGELTAGIAHEIQNPLNFVNNFSEVNKELLEEMKEEIEKGNYQEVKALVKDVSDNEDKIIYHGKRADGIVKGMLQHSRSSSGLKEPTDINVLADEYLRLAYHGLRAKDKSFNATLNTDFDPSIGEINIVPQDIGRVILNLITNAFYVVKEKKELHPNDFEPTVTVSTKKKDAMVMISVTDNGNGIPKKVLDKIFQPFFTTKPSGKGTGLGLSLSYDIVKVHHGELTVETEEGKGTTFIISLPIT